MRISDWSSDVCSSDLRSIEDFVSRGTKFSQCAAVGSPVGTGIGLRLRRCRRAFAHPLPCSRELVCNHDDSVLDLRLTKQARRVTSCHAQQIIVGIVRDRKSVVSGTRVYVRVDLGGRAIINKNTLYYILLYDSL